MENYEIVVEFTYDSLFGGLATEELVTINASESMQKFARLLNEALSWYPNVTIIVDDVHDRVTVHPGADGRNADIIRRDVEKTQGEVFNSWEWVVYNDID